MAEGSVPGSFAPRFDDYFKREVALQAAKPLSDRAQIQFSVGGSDRFYFQKSSGGPAIVTGSASDADIEFQLTPAAAEAVLADPAADIGSIGVAIARLIASGDPQKKIHVRLKAGFLTLFSKGYLGVVGAGGSQFAGFLASKGLGGLSAIKETIKKLKA